MHVRYQRRLFMLLKIPYVICHFDFIEDAKYLTKVRKQRLQKAPDYNE